MGKPVLVAARILAALSIVGKPEVPWAQTVGRTVTGSFPAVRKAAQTAFYVATDGNDSWTGKLDRPNAARTDGPFLTLQRAQKAVRNLKARGPLKAPVTVYVRGGRYALAKPLVFDEQATDGNVISNNHIHDIGLVYSAAVGIWVGQSSDNIISHNEINDT